MTTNFNIEPYYIQTSQQLTEIRKFLFDSNQSRDELESSINDIENIFDIDEDELDDPENRRILTEKLIQSEVDVNNVLPNIALNLHFVNHEFKQLNILFLRHQKQLQQHFRTIQELVHVFRDQVLNHMSVSYQKTLTSHLDKVDARQQTYVSQIQQEYDSRTWKAIQLQKQDFYKRFQTFIVHQLRHVIHPRYELVEKMIHYLSEYEKQDVDIFQTELDDLVETVQKLETNLLLYQTEDKNNRILIPLPIVNDFFDTMESLRIRQESLFYQIALVYVNCCSTPLELMSNPVNENKEQAEETISVSKFVPLFQHIIQHLTVPTQKSIESKISQLKTKESKINDMLTNFQQTLTTYREYLRSNHEKHSIQQTILDHEKSVAKLEETKTQVLNPQCQQLLKQLTKLTPITQQLLKLVKDNTNNNNNKDERKQWTQFLEQESKLQSQWENEIQTYQTAILTLDLYFDNTRELVKKEFLSNSNLQMDVLFHKFQTQYHDLMLNNIQQCFVAINKEHNDIWKLIQNEVAKIVEYDRISHKNKFDLQPVFVNINELKDVYDTFLEHRIRRIGTSFYRSFQQELLDFLTTHKSE